MGRLILCYPKKADKPYFVKTMNLNLYTLEELCYFLYDNLYWIDETVVNNELLDWLIYELQLTDLSEGLRANLSNVKNFVMIILKYADYISEDDLEDANRLLGELGGQSDFDKTLGRAWHFLQCKLYMEAILEYKKLIERNENRQLEKIYNNMGVAYARLFLYKEAAKCFQKGYKINNDQTIYNHYQYAVAMISNEDIQEFQKDLERNYKAICKIAIQSVQKEQENKKLNQLEDVLNYKTQNHVAEYYKGLGNLLNEWKKEYENYTG